MLENYLKVCEKVTFLYGRYLSLSLMLYEHYFWLNYELLFLLLLISILELGSNEVLQSRLVLVPLPNVVDEGV